jgi:hypothetical protein
MTHHNQTKELTTWFLNLSLDESLTTKARSLKFESKTPRSTARRSKKPKKAQEGHLEDGKPQKLTTGTKSSRSKQNDKEEQENLKTQ